MNAVATRGPQEARRRHPDERPVRRALRALSTVLIAAGVLLLVDATLTFFWQEPLSSLWTSHRQSVLRNELQVIARRPPTPPERRLLARLGTDRARIAYLAETLRRRTEHGQALGRIRIPKADADFVIVKGDDPPDLRRGPGVYDGSPLPGSSGTVAIAGHRTTYLSPFRHIDRLRAGDPVTVDMPYARFTYRVVRRRIVSPQEVSVIRRVRYDQLVLTACHPLFSAAQRIVVFARLVGVQPRGILARR
ncbi:MAG: class sortase [Solirubrobacterales bacterium]|nr:class sortase [Solirubrobacterales bacterium]